MLRLLRWWPAVLALAAAGSSAQMARTCAQLAAKSSPRAAAAPAAVALLQQRRDLRSLALADYLLAASGAAEGEAARERLQDRARSSTDPMLTVLALHMPCVRPGCRNIEASQWSRLEPANLLAWLALPVRTSADGRYLLNEIATHVRHARSYRAEADALLSDLPPSGLALRQPWGLLHLRVLTSACHGPVDVRTAERCDAVAELLWADGGATERLMALILGRQSQRLLPERQSVWEPRLRELEAATRGPGQPWTLLLSGPMPKREQVCEAIVLPGGGERATADDWERARVVVQAAGLPLWELRLPTRADAMRTLH